VGSQRYEVPFFFFLKWEDGFLLAALALSKRRGGRSLLALFDHFGNGEEVRSLLAPFGLVSKQ